MKQNTLAGLLASALCASIASASGTPVLAPRATTTVTPITITGNAFFQGSDRFYIRGVDYQPGGGTGAIEDPIANATACERDIAYFNKLGINTIRVYVVDNTANHDDCMNALAENNIYLILDVTTPLYSLNQDDPSESYNSVFLQSVFATIDVFAGYSNTMAFLSGNEVINEASNTDAAPYVKATTRDMKQYIGDRGYREIPVGYSAADVASDQQILAEYLNCGTENERTDFYSINDYSWCDPSSFTTSGWDTLVANYTGYGIPLFMSEYGCITNNRTFEEVAALYSTEMTGVFSGGLVYEYSEEGNGYGLVTINDDGTVTTEPDFDYLKIAYEGTSNPTGLGGATTTSAASTCPTESTNWEVANDDVPAIPAAAEVYMSTGAGEGPGLTGDGSQESGNSSTESTGTAGADAGAVTATGSSATSTKKSSANMVQPKLDLSMIGVVFVTLMGVAAGMLAL